MDLVHLPASFTSRASAKRHPSGYLRSMYCTLRRLRGLRAPSGTSCTLRWSSGGFGPPSGYLLYPSAASGASGRLRVRPVPFGDPPEASGRLRGTSCTLRRLRGLRGRLRVPPVPFGDPPKASGRLRGISCTLRWVLFAGLVGPVGCPYDKPLAVDVLLRHG